MMLHFIRITNLHFYSSAGHPGPSKVAIEIDLNIFEEILSVGHNRIFKKL